MGDLISRQAVKDIMFNRRGVRIYTHKGEKLKRYAEIDLDDFDAIPSAQPEIIRCKDCVYQTESWSGIKYCETHGDHIGKDYDYCSNARRKENGH